MRTETTEVLIVGAGACGSLVAKELAARGLLVVTIEAGKRFKAATDLVNAEANAGKIMWTEPRVYTGKDAIGATARSPRRIWSSWEVAAGRRSSPEPSSTCTTAPCTAASMRTSSRRRADAEPLVTRSRGHAPLAIADMIERAA